MGDRKLSIGQWFLVIIIASLVPAISLWMGYQFLLEKNERKEEAVDLLVYAPENTSLALPVSRNSGEITLYEFSPELREAYIYDIVVDGEQLWIGTGKGLLAFAEGHYANLYRQFSRAPFEWINNLALENDLLALDTLVATGSTGGHYAGSHIFNTQSKEWHRLGKNILDQTWLNGSLWQRPLDRTLVKYTTDKNGTWIQEEIPIQGRLCSEAYMSAINNEIWIAQQGTVHFHGGAGINYAGSQVKALPCGVLRYNPETGEETLYEESDGLNSGFGRDVAGDEHQVWVSHSIKYDKLSLFDPVTGQWQSARPYGSGNRIALSKKAVWLASPSSSDPLIRIDRTTQKRKNIQGIPKDFYVSAIAIDSENVWVGLYKKNWKDSTYTITSYLARYIDNEVTRN